VAIDGYACTLVGVAHKTAQVCSPVTWRYPLAESMTIYGRPYAVMAHCPVLTPCAPHDVLARLGDKWTILVMSVLALAPGNRLRFSEIKNGVKGISQRMLRAQPDTSARVDRKVSSVFRWLKYSIRAVIPGWALTLTLRNLERDGLLTRHCFPEVPPRVEYEVSTMGRSMLPALEAFTGWIRSNWPAIEQSRQDFDARRKDCS